MVKLNLPSSADHAEVKPVPIVVPKKSNSNAGLLEQNETNKSLKRQSGSHLSSEEID